MVLKRIFPGVMLVGALLGLSPAWAEPASSSPTSSAATPSEAVTPAKLALAQKIVIAADGAGTMRRLVEAMSAGFSKGGQGLGGDPAMQNVMSRVFREEMDQLTAKIMPQMAGIYAETFSEQELADILAFYQSPTGKKLVEKLPELSRRGQAIVTPMIPGMQRDILIKIFDGMCEARHCTAEERKTMEQAKERVLDQLKAQEAAKAKATI